LSSRTSKSLIGYGALHKFSVGDPATFWPAGQDFTKISGETVPFHFASMATRVADPSGVTDVSDS